MTTKFSQFNNGGNFQPGDLIAGLRGGQNFIFNAVPGSDVFLAPAVAGTTTNLTATYNNGAAGIGATLTNAGVMAAFSVDGITPGLNSRILVKNQAFTFQNGIYTLTNAGSGGTNWVLTRATDFNTPAQIVPGELIFVQTGTVNALTVWEETSTVTTIGVDPILFVETIFPGGVLSVTGTPGRITSTGGQNPIINIDPTYVGQASITTLGTITTGAWNGSLIPLAFGGTNANLTANFGGIFYSTASAGAILAGTPTALQMLQSGASAAPSWSTTTWPATSTINQILYSSAANTITGLPSANSAVLTTGATGIPVLTLLALDGQIIIGSTAGAPAAASLTAGPGISIVNAGNSITISVSGGGTTWTVVTTATQALVVENGYITNRGAGVTYTLPASGAIGDEIIIVGELGITTIAQNANQQILMSSASSTVGVGGSVHGTNLGDCINLVCIVAGASTIWRARNWVGNWTVT